MHTNKETSYISFTLESSHLPLAGKGVTTHIVVAPTDWPGVIRAAGDVASDLAAITGFKPELRQSATPPSESSATGSSATVLVGTIGKSPLIDGMIARGSLDVSEIAGKSEAFLIARVEGNALVIAGTDKRGTIFGLYDLCEEAGMSPWHWWADSSPIKRDLIAVKRDVRYHAWPTVAYRGIFLNDEYPALSRWVAERWGDVPLRSDPPTHGGIANYNSEFYKTIFTLILRLKGNYLWPAMWNNAFNEDDPLNPILADEYGIVMGTSHQEPMTRAQKEWDRRYEKKYGHWDYHKHADVLKDFWREGIRNSKDHENLITIGLRGANDTPMADGSAQKNMAMLEEIVAEQRKIIAEVHGKPAEEVPQMWCLYKEAQDFYDLGMQVPDDVTLLWSDDNWGNLRRVPTQAERGRKGGAGIYYHFDYHGGPRSYQWMNTSPIAKVRDQMALAREYGADKVWIVNMGHFKGYELPLDYFMHLAWDTDAVAQIPVADFTRRWAEREFGAVSVGGDALADRVTAIMDGYTRINGRCKPELLSPNTYSPIFYREAELVSREYNRLLAEARELINHVCEAKRDAFRELVQFPVEACALVHELYATAGRNALWAAQGRSDAGSLKARVEELFQQDLDLMDWFNHQLAGGKWNHFMDQTHLGYIAWNDPPVNSLQAIPLAALSVPTKAGLGLWIAETGSEAVPHGAKTASLPEIDSLGRQTRYFEIFNRGLEPFECVVTADSPRVSFSLEYSGFEPVSPATPGTAPSAESPARELLFTVDRTIRVAVAVDWGVPESLTGAIRVSGAGAECQIEYRATYRAELPLETLLAQPQPSFAETAGIASIEAERYADKRDADGARWVLLADYGHTKSGMRAESEPYVEFAPPTAARSAEANPRLTYRVYLFESGPISATTVWGPSLNILPHRGVRYAIALDDGEFQTVTLVPKGYNADHTNGQWCESVIRSGRYGKTDHRVASAGWHTVTVAMVDPGLVLERVILHRAALGESWLGPAETVHS